MLERYLNNFVSKELPLSPSRYFGGQKEDVYHPYFSHNFYTIFNLPSRVFGGNKRILEQNLISTCETCAIPERTLNYGVIPGLGWTKIYIPTNQSISNTIELTFKETDDLPIWAIVEQWASAIRNAHFGISGFTNSHQNDYKGDLTVVICKIGCAGNQYAISDINSVYHFEGIAPTSSPGGQLDINNGEANKQSMPLTFDGFPVMISNDIGLEKLNAYGVTPKLMQRTLSV